MKNFQIEIKKELSRIIYVDAENPDDAIIKAVSLYKEGEIVLDADDFTGEPDISLFPKISKDLDKSEISFHITKIIDYLEFDEKKDYEQNQYPRNHIYHSIAYLKQHY